MLPFRKITLADKPSFDRILKVLQPEISDLTFANLWMWQHSYGLLVYYEPDLDFWLLMAKPSNPKWKPFFLPPVGDWGNETALKKVYQLMIETAATEKFVFQIRRAPKEIALALIKFEQRLSAELEKDTSDYLYSATDLINLAGRKYHSKRNHLNKFLRKYVWEYQPLTPELVKACLNLETAWFNLKITELSNEIKAMVEIFENFDYLGLAGAVIRVDGVIQAITVGERLNQNTAVIHIEKANTEFEGIYATVNQQFVANQWTGLEFINREEDMGIEGLKKAKLSYYPIRMVEKYTVALI